MTTPAARASYNVGYDLKLALPLALFFLVFFIAPLLLLFFLIGLFPNLFLNKINPSVTALLDNQPALVQSAPAGMEVETE